MNKCKDILNIKSIYIINTEDIKDISKEKGILMKRKYGRFKRVIKFFDF